MNIHNIKIGTKSGKSQQRAFGEHNFPLQLFLVKPWRFRFILTPPPSNSL
ncbi:hypothetical protein H1Q63_10100 [Desmonostoc muscorum CCALA 125]|nr:hypothetical protein [Desmonostoc muscorum CCALA 125]